MPSQAASCSDAKQQYINGHFCYADKFAILTNGLVTISHIAFLDDDFKAVHPQMTVQKLKSVLCVYTDSQFLFFRCFRST